MGVLENRAGSIVAADREGVLTLELRPVIVAVAHQLASLGVAESQLNSLSVHMPLVKVSGIVRARMAVRWLARAAFWLPLLALATLIGAVLTAVNRRRALVVVGASVAAAMAAFAAVLWIGSALMVRGMTDAVSERAAKAALSVVTASLRSEMWTTAIVGLTVAGLGVALLAAARRGPGPATIAASRPELHP